MTKDNSGRDLEAAVGRVQELLAPNCTVTYREKIKNRHGHFREFDIVLRGTFAGYPAIGVIECKDWKDRVGTEDIDAFVTKTADINANIKLMVSRTGFTRPAIEQAAHYGIGLYSLLPNDQSTNGFTVGVRCLARDFCWSNVQLFLNTTSTDSPNSSHPGYLLPTTIQSLKSWVLVQLSTEHVNITRPGVFARSVRFQPPLLISEDGKQHNLLGLTFSAIRHRQTKSGYIQVNGAALYNWDTRDLLIPRGERLQLTGLTCDISDWQDYSGDLADQRSHFIFLEVHFLPAAVTSSNDLMIRWNHSETARTSKDVAQLIGRCASPLNGGSGIPVAVSHKDDENQTLRVKLQLLHAKSTPLSE